MLRFDSSSCCSALYAVGSNSPTAIGCSSRCCIDGIVPLTNNRRNEFERSNRGHAAAATSRDVRMAEARNARCVLAEIRWRWTLKVL